MPTLTTDPLEPDERARLLGTKADGRLIVVVALVFTAVPVGLLFLTERRKFHCWLSCGVRGRS